MSKEAGQSIQDQIIAELSAGPSAQAEPVAAPPANLETETAAPAPAPSVQAEVPRLLHAKIAGEEVEVPLYNEQGQINPELVVAFQKAQDYTRKMMAVANDRRAVEAERLAWQAEQIKAQQSTLPDLPEDDPYAQRIAAQQKQLELLAQQTSGVEQFLANQRSERELDLSRAALALEEKRLATEHGLTPEQIKTVEYEYYRREKSGEEVSLDAIAKSHASMLAQVKADAIREWKEKKRVGAPAGGASSPATGSAPAVITPKSPGFIEAFMNELGVTG
jgi:hypothetical protein